MNYRTSNREARIVVLEEELRDVRRVQASLLDRADRIDERLDRITDALLKLSRELGAQREQYPLK